MDDAGVDGMERGGGAAAYDRTLLLGPKRNDLLDLGEVLRYGEDSFGDPDHVSIYGRSPAEWYGRGVRLLGRTAVECTRDPLADLIGRDIAALAETAPGDAAVVLDPFAGSANTLYWIGRRLPGIRCVGFELDGTVFSLTRRNLSILGIDLELRRVDYRDGVAALAVPPEELLVVFVAPPWGDALSETSGLDLRRTTPPVAEIVELIASAFPRHRLLLATQIHERVDGVSLAELNARFEWSTSTVYGIDRPGRNHGLSLGTIGWTPPIGRSPGRPPQASSNALPGRNFGA